jgi:glyoxylase-like metal-dependent hydrolase (beta-lactamase superfamily II)
LIELGPNLFLQRDTTNVYVIRSGGTATCVDFGDGTVLDRLGEIGVDEITDVVMTHHHRDGAQGLHRAAARGARIWVPAVERDLFARVEEHWQARPVENMYDLREDRFSLFASVRVAGTVDEYRARAYGRIELTAVPTPGHTPGSMSYVADLDGQRCIFSGDLIREGGKLHSIAATQWVYNGLDGCVLSIVSALDLLDQSPDLLRAVEGTEVWAAENFAHILGEPQRFDLPCLWYDAIPVDRVLPLAQPFRWREYELTLHELPGHTLYAVALEFEVDGKTLLATGDQQDGGFTEGRVEFTGFNYRNRFRIDDYARSADLYRRIAPEIIITGHAPPTQVTPEYLDMLQETGRKIAGPHRELLPLEELDFGAEGVAARIEPYRPVVLAGQPLALDVRARNPFPERHDVQVELVVPDGWDVAQPLALASADAKTEVTLSVEVTPPVGASVRRARVGADLTVGRSRFGIQAEALVTVEPEEDAV